jgi:hypothetical protein
LEAIGNVEFSAIVGEDGSVEGLGGQCPFEPLIVRGKERPAKANFRHKEDVKIVVKNKIDSLSAFIVACVRRKILDVLESNADNVVEFGY